MGDHHNLSAEKQVDCLKSLNERIIKETKEKIATLVESETELKSELTRSESENNELRVEMDEVSDENIRLEIESDIVRAWIRGMNLDLAGKEEEIRNLKDEVEDMEMDMERLLERKNDIAAELDAECAEVYRLEIVEADYENACANLRYELGKWKNEGELNQLRLEVAVKERDELRKVRDENKEKLEAVLYEKNEWEEAGYELKKENEDLVEHIQRLHETVRRLTVEVGDLQDQVRELEEKEESLVKEKANNIEQLSQEKTELEGRILSKEAKIVELNQKVEELMSDAAVLRKEFDDETNANTELNALIYNTQKQYQLDYMNYEAAVEALQKELTKRDTTIKELRDRVDDETKTNEELSENVGKLNDALAQAGVESNREAELESLQKEITNRDATIEEMRQTLDEARRSKDFWTFVSSMTAVSAAVSFIHACRCRRNTSQDGFSR